MAVIFDTDTCIFHLDTMHTSYQMKVDDLGYLLHLYYGEKTGQDMSYRLVFLDRGFSGNPGDRREGRNYSLDVLPQEYPFKGTGDCRGAAFVMENEDKSLAADLRYVSHEILKEKYQLVHLPSAAGSPDNTETLKITLRDARSGMEADLLYGVYEAEDVITRAVILRNSGSSEVTIRKAASCCLDFLSGNFDLLHFHGRHTMEMQAERTPVGYALTSIGSRRGTSSHQHNPAVILTERETTEESGRAYGCLLSYSGGFLCEAERDQFGQTRFIMGISDDQLAYPLGPQESLELPECILTYTKNGFRDLSLRCHDFFRRYILRDPYRGKPHPVLINSWEAAYFDFDGQTILKLAKGAKDLGLDMVVMDDGWFGNRRDDFRGLGDWYVNEKKLGMSLGELISKVEDMGLLFGLWIEPEMISEDTELYRAHPDWALTVPGKDPVFARDQLVLDFSRKEVRDHIFDSITKVLDQGHVSYVKWDMNRGLSDIWSAVHVPGKVKYEYTAGVYEFLKRLIGRYPDLLIEGCSGGGGRFDAGMLSFTPQIWASDNSDAVDRVMIQYGYSYFYPAATLGAHVSAVPNHQNGRVTPLKTRGIVAMAGTFGYELDPAKLSKEEKEEIRAQIRDYKRFEGLIREGDYYRLSDPGRDGYAAWAFVSKDLKEMLLSYVLLENHSNMEVRYIRAAGLNGDLKYRSEADGRLYEGAALMDAGLPVPPALSDYAAGQIYFHAEKSM